MTAPGAEPSTGTLLNRVGWALFQLVATRGASYLVLLVLMTLLAPEDFGLLGMAVVFTGLIAVVGDLGLAAALIRRRASELTTDHLDAAFWASASFNGAVFACFALLVAPAAVWFYNIDAIGPVIAVLSVQALLATLGVIPRALLTRDLRFKTLALIEAASTLTAGLVSISLALRGWGVWSLVLQGIIATLISTPLLWRSSPWRPRWRFSTTALRDIVGFGAYDTLHRLVIYLSKNIDYLLVGKLLGVTSLGLYSAAFLVTDTFRQHVMAVLNRVLLPVYGRLQDNPARVKAHYLGVVRYNALAVSAPMAVLAMLAGPLVGHFLGAGWEGAVLPMQAMAIACMIHAMGGATDAVFKGIGEIRLLLRIYLLKTTLVTAPAFWFGIQYYGINGAAGAVLLHKLAGRLINQHFMAQLLGVTERDIGHALAPTLCGGFLAVAAMALVAHLVDPAASASALVAVACAGLAGFVAGATPLLISDLRQWRHHLQTKS